MLFPEGLKCKIALPEGVQVLSRRVHYTGFFAFQRGKNSQTQRSSTGEIWFLNVIAPIFFKFWPRSITYLNFLLGA
jgi:hypothetical protein